MKKIIYFFVATLAISIATSCDPNIYQQSQPNEELPSIIGKWERVEANSVLDQIGTKTTTLLFDEFNCAIFIFGDNEGYRSHQDFTYEQSDRVIYLDQDQYLDLTSINYRIIDEQNQRYLIINNSTSYSGKYRYVGMVNEIDTTRDTTTNFE